ncbi:cob(I)yrinic acid a,c-diamide adenosyltransferase [Patescibacteria group bacterium]|nr:cob(I)yrinic acid a,c-diamide adenosyltransferase [Patescibacteria group bacterium]
MLYIYTGDGKGKTTAAVGSLIRGYGAGKPCAIVFFDKTSERCAELDALLELGIHAHVFGANRILARDNNDDSNEGGDFRFENIEEDFIEAKKALEKAQELAKFAEILVLDEFLNAIRVGIVHIKQALLFVEEFPQEKLLILTGRGLPEEIELRADLISEIKNIRHPFDQLKNTAVPGIDY